MRCGVVLPIEAASRSTFCFWATGDLGLKGKVGGVRTESRILAFCIAFWVTFNDACFEPHDRAKMYTIAIELRCGMQGLRGEPGFWS